MVLVLFASACGSSNDPKSWTEAGIDGGVQVNFVTACQTANANVKKMTDIQANNYCTRSFEALVNYYGGQIIQPGNVLQDRANATPGRDFAAFLKLDKNLRKDPTSIPPQISELLSKIEASVTK